MRESSTASPRPGRPLLLVTRERLLLAPTASQPASTALLAGVSAQGILWVVPGPPAVAEMSRPLQGSRSGVKTAARSNGTTVWQAFTRSKDGSIGMDELRSSPGSCWAYMCAQVPARKTPSGLCTLGYCASATPAEFVALLLGLDWCEREHRTAVLLEGNGIFSSAVVDLVPPWHEKGVGEESGGLDQR